MTALLALAFVVQMQNSGSSDVFQIAKQLVGGTWEGVVGKDTIIRFKFHTEDDGNKIVGDGWIDANGKHPTPVRSSYGWDPDLKQVYYLDQHGYKTVYFGHVTREGDSLVTDFKGLVGDSGHYLGRANFSANRYISTMAVEEKGAWKDLGFHLEMRRISPK